MVLAAQDLIPPATADPSGVWFFNWVIPIAGSVFIVLAVADVVRRRRLTWGFLFLFNSMAVYWMETARRLGPDAVLQPRVRRASPAGLAAAEDARTTHSSCRSRTRSTGACTRCWCCG